MSQMLGYFYVIPISISFFLVLWWVRKSQEPTHSKRFTQLECDEKREKKERKA
jgi:hypothetical protein